MPEGSNEKLLVFSDDWGRHPSSCQHLIKRFLKSHHVVWVNTIGMRPPRLDLLTVKRGFEKIGGWISQRRDTRHAQGNATEVTGQLRPLVYDSKMWPWMSGKLHRAINRRLLARQLHELATDATVLTSIPIVADLVGNLPAKKWVYYCVDDFSVWPGLSGEMLGRMEDELLPKMDRIIAVSETLKSSIAERGFDAEMLTHGVDIEFWRQGFGELVVDQRDLESPIFLFWGVIDRRMNADWILALSEELERGTILLLGPQQDPDPRLTQCSRVMMPGPASYESLPAHAELASALIMPYIDAPVTRAMQPLKLKEYLATEKPVVATELPAVARWCDCLDAVNTKEEFVSRCLEHGEAQESPLDRVGRVRARLRDESWDAKAKRFANWISSTASG